MEWLNSTYQATQECADWCLSQKIIGYHNLETQTVMIAAAALILIIASEWANEYEQTKKLFKPLIYFAKLSLYFFFYIYFFYIKGGI